MQGVLVMRNRGDFPGRAAFAAAICLGLGGLASGASAQSGVGEKCVTDDGYFNVSSSRYTIGETDLDKVFQSVDPGEVPCLEIGGTGQDPNDPTFESGRVLVVGSGIPWQAETNTMMNVQLNFGVGTRDEKAKVDMLEESVASRQGGASGTVMLDLVIKADHRDSPGEFLEIARVAQGTTVKLNRAILSNATDATNNVRDYNIKNAGQVADTQRVVIGPGITGSDGKDVTWNFAEMGGGSYCLVNGPACPRDEPVKHIAESMGRQVLSMTANMASEIRTRDLNSGKINPIDEASLARYEGSNVWTSMTARSGSSNLEDYARNTALSPDEQYRTDILRPNVRRTSWGVNSGAYLLDQELDSGVYAKVLGGVHYGTSKLLLKDDAQTIAEMESKAVGFSLKTHWESLAGYFAAAGVAVTRISTSIVDSLNQTTAEAGSHGTVYYGEVGRTARFESFDITARVGIESTVGNVDGYDMNSQALRHMNRNRVEFESVSRVSSRIGVDFRSLTDFVDENGENSEGMRATYFRADIVVDSSASMVFTNGLATGDLAGGGTPSQKTTIDAARSLSELAFGFSYAYGGAELYTEINMIRPISGDLDEKQYGMAMGMRYDW